MEIRIFESGSGFRRPPNPDPDPKHWVVCQFPPPPTPTLQPPRPLTALFPPPKKSFIFTTHSSFVLMTVLFKYDLFWDSTHPLSPRKNTECFFYIQKNFVVFLKEKKHISGILTLIYAAPSTSQQSAIFCHQLVQCE